MYYNPVVTYISNKQTFYMLSHIVRAYIKGSDDARSQGVLVNSAGLKKMFFIYKKYSAKQFCFTFCIQYFHNYFPIGYLNFRFIMDKITYFCAVVESN